MQTTFSEKYYLWVSETTPNSIGFFWPKVESNISMLSSQKGTIFWVWSLYWNFRWGEHYRNANSIKLRGNPERKSREILEREKLVWCATSAYVVHSLCSACAYIALTLLCMLICTLANETRRPKGFHSVKKMRLLKAVEKNVLSQKRDRREIWNFDFYVINYSEK